MRRRKATVELFEEIRREYEFGIGTIQGVARKFGVHRRLVREALNDAQPTQKPTTPRARPRLEPVAGFIDAILEPTARRRGSSGTRRVGSTSARARAAGHQIAESTVRQYVREWKAAAGLLARGRSCRRATRGAARRRSTGTRRWPTWTASG